MSRRHARQNQNSSQVIVPTVGPDLSYSCNAINDDPESLLRVTSVDFEVSPALPQLPRTPTFACAARSVEEGPILLQKSLAMLLNNDSVVLMRFAVEAIDDGAAQ